MSLSPIVLFVYNRPWHTQQTLEALEKNQLADQSVLYIYADGAKEDANEAQLKKIREVRKIVRSRIWCKEVEIVERDKNWGLADNIVDGVTEIVNKHGKVIVLEDDIVTSIGFLKYTNDALELYENEESVMHISGYMFPVKKKLPETFFYNAASCWGWGTWQRAWERLVLDPCLLLDEVKKQGRIIEFDYNQENLFSSQLISNKEGRIKTWAIFWHASVFINNGLCLHPFPSLVQNIGHDDSGIHCGNNEKYFHPQLVDKICVNRIDLIENVTARNSMLEFYAIKNTGIKAILSRAIKKLT